MALADLPHDLIDGGALRAALVAGDREGIRCEYKLRVHDSAEWCLDVTAFANTSGGVILVGAEEHEGRLVGLRGIDTNADDEVLRLENMLRDVVDPAIPGLRISPVDIGDGATVLVVSVPRSWRAPHLVRSTKRRWSLAKRNSAGKHVLGDASELRVAFSETLGTGERARRWHEDLVAAVAAGQTPVRVDRDRFLALSFRPIAAGAPGATPVLDVARARRDTSGPLSHAVFLYGSSISFGKRVNLDGVYIAVSGDAPLGYTQVFRDGSVAYVDDYSLTEGEGIAGTYLAGRIVGAFWRTPEAVDWVGGELPLVAQLTIHGADQREFHTRGAERNPPHWKPSNVFDRDRLAFPEIVIDAVPEDVHAAAASCRPMLDALWNAAGLVECEFFDDDGRWTGPVA